MNKYCCRLGSAIDQDRLLCKTDNFFVVPTLGAIGIEGYLLIVSKKHCLGFGMLPESFYPELNDLTKTVKGIIKDVYKVPSLIFEHGPRIGVAESGACIDHAHLHVVPGVDITDDWASDMIRRLGSSGMFYRVDRVDGFQRAKELCETTGSYLYVENLEGAKLISEQNFNRPRQYFRRMVAAQLGNAGWNWRKHPDRITLSKTLDKLAGKF